MFLALSVLGLFIGGALWQHLRSERMRSALTRLGTFLGDTHDFELEKAWGKELGVHASVGLHDPLRESWLRYVLPSRRTEILIELPAAYPLMIHVERRRWWSTARAAALPGGAGLRVRAAPGAVVRHLLDEATLTALRELRIGELTMVPGSPPLLRLTARGWMLDMERAQRAVSLAAGLVLRMAPALARADAELVAAARGVPVGEPYRGHADDSEAQRLAQARAAELEQVRGEVERGRRRQLWLTAALAVGALVLVGVVATAVGYVVVVAALVLWLVALAGS